ncbi:MAG: PEP-CTERM sorting domain-containing protein [Candidatus Firestonebacteria bacterium]|nr:PEP-CTERM sorting domain-containing protein [Candidatus Firestonebacteria bacterium]
MKKLIFQILMSFVFVLSISLIARATPITLEDENSTATIDPATQSGMYNWFVDGQDVLYQQWFWYRIGNTGPETSINTLSLVSNPYTSDSDGDGDVDSLYAKYKDAGNTFTIETKYGLTGSPSGSRSSDITETITINNTSGADLNFHFFQYTDFDLPCILRGNTANRINANLITQSGSLFFTEVSAIPAPNRWQIDYYPTIRTSLNDGSPTTLSNGTNGLGLGDMTFAFQWDPVITAGGSFKISKDKLVSPQIPEPGTMLLIGSLATGLFGFASARKRFNS